VVQHDQQRSYVPSLSLSPFPKIIVLDQPAALQPAALQPSSPQLATLQLQPAGSRPGSAALAEGLEIIVLDRVRNMPEERASY
jgi:hypothetical protein